MRFPSLDAQLCVPLTTPPPRYARPLWNRLPSFSLQQPAGLRGKPWGRSRWLGKKPSESPPPPGPPSPPPPPLPCGVSGQEPNVRPPSETPLTPPLCMSDAAEHSALCYLSSSISWCLVANQNSLSRVTAFVLCCLPHLLTWFWRTGGREMNVPHAGLSVLTRNLAVAPKAPNTGKSSSFQTRVWSSLKLLVSPSSSFLPHIHTSGLVLVGQYCAAELQTRPRGKR